MGTGGFNPAPFRFGASKHSVEETILNALNQGDGTALTTEQASYNYADNFAVARAIADVWSANRRLANQWDPQRMTDFLPRWEKIFGLTPALTDTEATRRAAVGAKLAMVGKPGTQQVVYDLLVTILGNIFIGIYNDASTTATASCPGGATIPGGVTLPDGPWSSSLMYVAVKLSRILPNQQFYALAGKIYTYLDGLLPAWVDFGWFVPSDSNDVGFWLDELNLDNEGFA